MLRRYYLKNRDKIIRYAREYYRRKRSPISDFKETKGIIILRGKFIVRFD